MNYFDLVIKRQIILERIKTGLVRDANKELAKLERMILQRINGVNGDISSFSRDKLAKLLSDVRNDQLKVMKTITDNLFASLETISGVYMAQEFLDLTSSIDLGETTLKRFTTRQAYAKALSRPLSVDGDLLTPFINGMTTKEIANVSKAIRAGHINGSTNDEIKRALVGTGAFDSNEGVTKKTRRNAATVTRTAVQHIASAARQELWEANTDVVVGYIFNATLDSVTSSLCRSLDQQRFEIGKGPIPPLHPNCRSTTIADLDPKFEFLSQGRTRAAEFGPVKGTTQYYQWLNRQTKSVQVEVLGPTRAKLFRDGGLTPERFRQLQLDKTFAPTTLKYIQSIEPAAFKLAGIKL